MPPRRAVPPPSRATRADAYRFVLGVLAIVLGIVILVRTLGSGISTPPAILTGAGFLLFGLYRVYVGIVRYRLYKQGAGRSPGAGRAR